MAPQRKPHRHLYPRENVPKKTSAIIIATVLTLGLIILVFGLWYIYEAYMKRVQLGRELNLSQGHRQSNRCNQTTAQPRSEIPGTKHTHITPIKHAIHPSRQQNITRATYRDTWPDYMPHGNRLSAHIQLRNGNKGANVKGEPYRTGRKPSTRILRRSTGPYKPKDFREKRAVQSQWVPTRVATPPERYLPGHWS